MSQYAKEGANAEKNFVIEMNNDNNDPRWRELGIEDAKNYFAIRVTTQKMSKIHGKQVFCKSDVFIAKSEKKFDNSYLTEEDLKQNGLEPVNDSGISIKKDDAKNIQWVKMTINTVKKLFGDAEIGAGISLYERKGTNDNSLDESMKKNMTIVEKWCDSIEAFESFYDDISDISKLFDSSESDEIRQEIAKKVGKFATNKMKNEIDTNEELQKKIFWGIGVFADPFCATWVFEDGKLKKTKSYVPKYSITTGSNRTENFAISIKGSK